MQLSNGYVFIFCALISQSTCLLFFRRMIVGERSVENGNGLSFSASLAWCELLYTHIF
jgi:hypothetical protein